MVTNDPTQKGCCMEKKNYLLRLWLILCALCILSTGIISYGVGYYYKEQTQMQELMKPFTKVIKKYLPLMADPTEETEARDNYGFVWSAVYGDHEMDGEESFAVNMLTAADGTVIRRGVIFLLEEEPCESEEAEYSVISCAEKYVGLFSLTDAFDRKQLEYLKTLFEIYPDADLCLEEYVYENGTCFPVCVTLRAGGKEQAQIYSDASVIYDEAQIIKDHPLWVHDISHFKWFMNDRYFEMQGKLSKFAAETAGGLLEEERDKSNPFAIHLYTKVSDGEYSWYEYSYTDLSSYAWKVLTIIIVITILSYMVIGGIATIVYKKKMKADK